VNKSRKLNPALIFVAKFLCLFGLLYGFYILYLGVTSPGGLYIGFFDRNLNFISWLRYALIETSAVVLNLFGYETKTSVIQVLVVGHTIIHIGYDCLGFGVMCFFTAFVIAYPGTIKGKWYFGIFGLIVIQIINIARFVLLSLYWKHGSHIYISDHHTVFNIIVYIVIAVSMYFYIRYQDKATALNASKN
jgi:exosortase/archaeosortase family protein